MVVTDFKSDRQTGQVVTDLRSHRKTGQVVTDFRSNRQTGQQTLIFLMVRPQCCLAIALEPELNCKS